MKKFLVLFSFIVLVLQAIGQELNYDTLTSYKINKKSGIIDNHGKIVLKPTYDLLSVTCRDRLITVSNNERHGVVDRKGNVVVPVIYKFVFSFHNGLSLVQDTLGNEGYIDEQGKVKIPLIYDPFTFSSFSSIYSSGLIQKYSDMKFGYIDGLDNSVIPCEYEEAELFLDDKAIVGQKDNWSITLYGTIDKSNKVLIPLEYNYLEYQYDDLYYAGKFFNFGKPDYHYAMGCLNSKNEIIVPFKYDSIQLRQKYLYVKGNECHQLRLENFIACNIREEGWRIVHSRNGKETACCYTDVGEVKGGYLEVKKDKWGLVDSLGNVKIPLIYDFVEIYGDEVVAVKKNNKWAYFKTDGTQTTDFVYDYTTEFRLGYALVKQNGKYHLIDKTGKVKLSNFSVNKKEGAYIHHPVQGRNTLLFCKKGKYGLMNMNGKIIFPAKSEDAILFVR
ncbi:MAG: WG repeat-containing protein [Sporocytophaga sp.]|uniref:WG repeat-containing protein n=1 Tax=Sporocytophaga sp. TaxID=2231183 RepID=UPI001AFEAFB5|nr:WG repeat-containing protein [Sporocytophaga sp.]MBO9698567.1 WG repeat-containing protein [Sporocytophaga sp.]